ncbi:MAG: hypothetical protein ACLQGV_13740 [Bryobacteraceae bacterium]
MRELTGKRQSGKDVKRIVAELTPVLRGWGTISGRGTPAGSSTRWTTSWCGACAAGNFGGVGNGRPSERHSPAIGSTGWACTSGWAPCGTRRQPHPEDHR